MVSSCAGQLQSKISRIGMCGDTDELPSDTNQRKTKGQQLKGKIVS